ncbi:MAG: hypothetical protein JSS96_12050 [Bacteroidetes bacterium]|nr:hypothetical protein [Bacteroidota bacterium]
MKQLGKMGMVFLSLKLSDASEHTISTNFYWMADSNDAYPLLAKLSPARVEATARYITKDSIELTLINDAAGPVAFFNRISLINSKDKQRILPVYYSDNYISILPGERQIVILEYKPQNRVTPSIRLGGWNVPEQIIKIHK